MQHLLLVQDDNGKRIVELHAASSSIGRDPRNSIVIHSCEVSRQHAILLRVTHPGKDEHEFRMIDGNLQGKPSTNGLFINGRQRTSHTLRHGDEIVFGVQVEARYLQAEEGTDVEWLLSGDDAAADYMSTMVCAAANSSDDAEPDPLDDSVLARFASFPELFVHPIIEITLTGEITYINPAAVKQFPEIQTEKINHPALSGIIETVKANQEEQSVREIALGDRIYEQSLSYIRQSDLIRSYLVEITDRRRVENELKALHDRLESEVEKRTLQFQEASKRLKKEEQALLASYATNRALLNAIPDPMFRIDRGGNFVNFKTPKHHTLPFDPEACLHRHLSDILPDAATKTIETCIHQALESEEMQMIEFQLPTGDPTGRISLDFEARIAISAPDEVVMITRDITERKRG
ncbi:MAG: FHA domain-containing protein, partial [Phormidesmis sp.]